MTLTKQETATVLGRTVVTAGNEHQHERKEKSSSGMPSSTCVPRAATPASWKSFRIVLSILITGCLAIFVANPKRALAQTATSGINSDGTDFFVGMMPGIVHGAYFSTGNAAAYFLICSYTDNNKVTIHYFNSSGNELSGQNLVLMKGLCQEVRIDPASIVPSRPGEVLEYKSAHITSKYPISVQVYTDGSSNGSMYQAIPTAALGKSYVVAAYNDNPLADNPGFVNRDSSSSEFMIIAPYDNTTVTFVPNATTAGLGITGCQTGAGSNGTPHPVTLTMHRGQVYWVRSNSIDISDDMSGSTVVADKPIVVLGGEERAMIGYPSGYWTTLDNDIRDEVGEEMSPVVDWGSDYPSIPTMPASITDVTIAGDGDMYRMFTNDPRGLSMNYWELGTPPQKFGPNNVLLYQPTEFDNITDPLDLLTDPSSNDPLGNPKKFYAVQYTYFQGHHDFNPNRKVGPGGGKGATPQSGGGANPLDETSYRAEGEIDLVPINYWKTSTVFMVPPNSNYNGYQFINIITNKDSLRAITIVRNNASSGALQSYTPSRTYQIPNHPELVGLTLKMPAGSYIISGNTPFVCYSYGRTETRYKDIFGYGAPTGQYYGSHAVPNPPKADIVPSCGQWNVLVHEGGTGGGIADVMLLNDPSGYIIKPPQVSYNCRLVGTGTDPQNPTAPPFVVGDTSLSVIIQVNDPSKDAYAALYAVDLSGNDTIIQLIYKAPSLALSTNKVALPDTLVLDQQCRTATFHVTSTGNLPNVNVFDSMFNTPSLFNITTNPPLPANLKAGDSVVFDFCFSPQDTNMHRDSLMVVGGCIDTIFYFQGKGLTPIIEAEDHDFGNVTVGNTACANIAIRNVGDAPLVLDSNYHLFNNPDYTFAGPIPDTIQPGGIFQYMRFCFHPSQKGPSNSQMNWGTNINPGSIYARHNKDTSLLLGYGRAAGLSWSWHNQQFTVECQAYDTEHVWLDNTSTGSDGADLTVDSLKVTGNDAKDFTVLAYNGNPMSTFAPFQLLKGDSILVDIQFKPDPTTGYQNRLAQIIASAHDAGGTGYSDDLNCTGIIRHAILSITPSSYNFGSLTPDSVVTASFVLLNSGDTNFDFNSIGVNSPDFKILSGPQQGDTLAPNMFDTVVIQFTAKHDGGASSGILHCGDNPCSDTTAMVFGSSSSVLVADNGHNFPVTYICRDNQASIFAADTGTEPVFLDSVVIMDNESGGAYANRFAFLPNGMQDTVLSTTLMPGQQMSFPVLFTPQASDNAISARVIFYYFDTTKGQHRPFERTDTLTGIGYQVTNQVTMRNPVLTANGQYSAVTAEDVATPIQIGHSFDTIAQVYGVQFTIRYVGDEFIPLQNGITTAAGITNQTPNAKPIPDPTDSRYNLLTLRLTSATPIIDSGTIVTANWQYVVAKDSISPFEVENVTFLDQNQDSACWVGAAVVSGSFYGLNSCGDATLRDYLKGGLPVVSIGDVIPNPAFSTTNVDFFVQQDGTPVTMRLFNALGEPVQTILKDQPYAKGGYRTTIDASNLPSGLYTIYLSAPGYGSSKQIIVTR